MVFAGKILQSSALCFAIWIARIHSFSIVGVTNLRKHSFLEASSMFGGDEDSAFAAVGSLSGYHEGEWKGTCRSFTVTPDVAAGVVKRKVSQPYTTAVKLVTSAQGGISLSETLSWDNKIVHRSIPLVSDDHRHGSVDVDDVDGSYSFDVTNPKEFPSILTGLGKKANVQFIVEHCIAAGEDLRCRCFAVYGDDDALLRVVVSEEHRVPSNNTENRTNQGAFTMQDLMEMQDDVDRLVDKIAASINPGGAEPGPSDSIDREETTSRLEQLGNSMAASQEENTRTLTPYDMSLLEVTNGVWLGDMIIRESPNVPSSPNEGGTGKGFGKTKASSSGPTAFGAWEMGVQKIALRWMWNFEEEIRQVVDLGKSLGISLDANLRKSLAGKVCLDESFSRRKPKEERMVYIDWGADCVGFLLGSYSVQVPRYLNFDPSATSSRAAAVSKPFYTEFGVFQSAPGVVAQDSEGVIDISDASQDVPDLCCSKIGRLYNYEGRLKQGCTSVYTFKRFEMEDESEEEEDDFL